MPQVRFEIKIPVFERAKTVHALDRAATLIGLKLAYVIKLRSEMTVRIASRNFLRHC
jgi:hypothetical protein